MSTSNRVLTAGPYWIGVAMTIACLSLVLAGNTELIWRFEHAGIPLSWSFGGATILAFLAGEFFHSAFFAAVKPPLGVRRLHRSGNQSSLIRRPQPAASQPGLQYS